MAPSGRHVPAEGLRRKPRRGLQDRLAWPAFSVARAGEGPHIGEPMFFIVKARMVPCDRVLATACPALPCV
jgi:hypothetical protein